MEVKTTIEIESLLTLKKARASNGSSAVDQGGEITSTDNEVRNKDQLHPLLVDVILENMFSYLDMKCVKRANLVCKPWFNALRKMMSKKMVFQFNEESALEFLKEYDGSTSPALITPTDVNTGISCIRLKLSLERSDCDELLDDKKAVSRISYATASALMERFMAMPATQIIELDVDICPRSPLLQFWKMMSSLSSTLEKLNIHTNCTCCGRYGQILTALPVAQVVLADHDNNDLSEFNNEVVTFPSLKVVSGEFRKFGRSNKIPAFLQKILTYSPNLEGLHCNMLSNDHVMFDVLKSKPDAFHALNSLSFVAMNNEEFQILLRKELKLKSLSVALHSGFRVLAFYKFLSSQGKSLESLSVDFVCLPNNPEAFFCAKDLTKLKHLTMSRFYGSIHFVSRMPNLETLVLQQINLSVALRDEAANFDYTSKLKSLQIFGGRGSTGRFLMPAVYYDIVSFFPELKQLRMEYFTDTTLRIILGGLPYLEELDIPNGIYSDEVLMGGCGTVLNTNGKRKLMEDGIEEIKPACFSDLKNLRKVVLQSPKITDAGIREGLVHCRELRSISIDSPMISDASLIALSQIPEIRHLEFLNCFQLTPAAISEAKALWGESRLLIIKNI